ncbi:MAG: class I SAM-dependent methyltransferase [Victivallales bacterium]|nr:class I SAM-dependent methyltransferase [Victivallales bacterium]
MATAINKRICPVWMGPILLSPLRRWWQNPRIFLAPWIKPGMTVLDAGCAMGFFSLPAAEMVGQNGVVLCVDVQDEMLTRLFHRALAAALHERIMLHCCCQSSLHLELWHGRIDFALAVAVVHETIDAGVFFREIKRTLKPLSRCLFVEPKWHVTAATMRREIAAATEVGFNVMRQWEWGGMRCALLEKAG